MQLSLHKNLCFVVLKINSSVDGALFSVLLKVSFKEKNSLPRFCCTPLYC